MTSLPGEQVLCHRLRSSSLPAPSESSRDSFFGVDRANNTSVDSAYGADEWHGILPAPARTNTKGKRTTVRAFDILSSTPVEKQAPRRISGRLVAKKKEIKS